MLDTPLAWIPFSLSLDLVTYGARDARVHEPPSYLRALRNPYRQAPKSGLAILSRNRRSACPFPRSFGLQIETRAESNCQ